MLTPTLRFRDDALEAEYAEVSLRDQRTQIRIAMAAGLAVWLACAGFDEVSEGRPRTARSSPACD